MGFETKGKTRRLLPNCYLFAARLLSKRLCESALPPIADIATSVVACPLSARKRHMHCSKTASLFDHLVGGYEQLVRHGETEHPGGLVIDDQLELVQL